MRAGGEKRTWASARETRKQKGLPWEEGEEGGRGVVREAESS